jgi:hypothetical protein
MEERSAGTVEKGDAVNLRHCEGTCDALECRGHEIDESPMQRSEDYYIPARLDDERDVSDAFTAKDIEYFLMKLRRAIKLPEEYLKNNH